MLSFSHITGPHNQSPVLGRISGVAAARATAPLGEELRTCPQAHGACGPRIFQSVLPDQPEARLTTPPLWLASSLILPVSFENSVHPGTPAPGSLSRARARSSPLLPSS